jgi:hypothetical protein
LKPLEPRVTENFPQLLDDFRTLCARLGVLDTVEQSRIPLDVVLLLSAVFAKLEQAKPSQGYEPYLIQRGWNQPAARGLAAVAERHGRRIAYEAKYWGPISETIRFLAQRQRQTRAVLKRVKLLLDTHKKTSIVSELCAAAGVSETELVQLLQAVDQRRDFDRQRLIQLARMLAPHLPGKRGPKISFLSAAHEFVIQQGAEKTNGGPHLEFRDRESLVQATRQEFNAPHFDPRPVRRRRKRAAKTGC